MKEIYTKKPETVEVFNLSGKSDVILRRGIQQVEQQAEGDVGATYVWECEERQFRYSGILTVPEVEAHFTDWWDYTQGKPTDESSEPTLLERVEALEALALEMVMS
jgi:hypothetical protein